MEDIKLIIAKNIVELRTSKGMTQLDLAEKLHYSDKSVSKWERAESVPEIATLTAIADFFEVPLDYLVHSEHKRKSESVGEDSSDARKRMNRSIITAMSILLVGFLSFLTYFLIDVIAIDVHNHWLSFVYALPVSILVWLIFNSIWFNRRRNYLIISLLVWTILAALHITFLAFGISIWHVYALGIPGQIVIILWSKLQFVQKENKG